MKKVFLAAIVLILAGFIINNAQSIISNNTSVNVDYVVPKVEDVSFYAECDGYISESASGNYKVKAYILEKDVPDIKLNSMVTVTGPALGDKEYEGYVSYIYDTATTITNAGFSKTVLECEITLKNGDNALKQGYNVTAKVLTLKVENALVINYETVESDSKSNYWVYLVNDDKAQKQYIEIFKESENGYIVSNGISQNDKVITEPSKIQSNVQRVNASLKGE